MTFVRERFNPQLMAANASFEVRGPHLGGFLAKTAGTLTVTSRTSDGLNAVTLVDAVPVSAGFYTPLPMIFPYTGGTVTLAGGASGTLFI